MQKTFQKRPRLNYQIREPQVKVIDTDGSQLGIMSTADAVKMATEKELDLVEIAPGMQPPIVKILDYGRYVYQKEKQERDKKGSKQSSQEVKVVKIGFKTEVHDLGIRLAQIEKFLDKGYRVKVEMRLRGRERQMVGIGMEKLAKFIKNISHSFVVDSPLKSFPGGMSTLIRPDKK